MINRMQYYKGGWIGDNAATDRKLTSEECKELLNLGGTMCKIRTTLTKKSLVLSGL